MTGCIGACGLTDKRHEMITGCNRLGLRAGMARTATAIHFACGYARQPNTRSLCAPDRPIAIPDRGWRADKTLAGRDGREEKKGDRHSSALTQLPRKVQAEAPWFAIAPPFVSRRLRAYLPNMMTAWGTPRQTALHKCSIFVLIAP